MSPLVDLVFPPRCALCGTAIARQSGVCGECWNELEFLGEPACVSCGRPFESSASQAGNLRCGQCLADPPIHAGIVAATRYNHASRKLVLDLKHGRKIALARIQARLIASRLPDCDDALLVPVPLHRWRLWRRGFNQAALLAEELARNGKGRLLVDGLVRHKPTPSLGGLGKRERRKALSGAIAVKPTRAKAIAGRNIILVDDVVTSGATSFACAEALLRARAKQVQIACLARVLD